MQFRNTGKFPKVGKLNKKVPALLKNRAPIRMDRGEKPLKDMKVAFAQMELGKGPKNVTK